MDHTTIDEQQIPERYLMDGLTGEERTLFEEHLLYCRQCAQRLELAKRFRRGMKNAAAETALEDLAQNGNRKIGGSWPHSSLAKFGLVAAALIVAVLIPTTLLRNQIRDLQHGLRQERMLRQNTERALTELKQPQTGTAVYFLSGQRDAGGAEAPTLQFPRATDTGFIVLCPELSSVNHERYEARLYDQTRMLWRAAGLQINQMETLVLQFPASFLLPGDFRLEVRAARGSDPSRVEATTEAEVFRFRVLAKP